MLLPTCHHCAGVYILICCVSQRFYIGSSTRLKKRLNAHRWALRRGDHENPRLQNAWNTYGEEAFMCGVLEYCDKSALVEREQHYLDRFRATDRSHGFNICSSAILGDGYKHHPKTIEALKTRLQRTKAQRTANNIKQHGKEFVIVSPTGEIIKSKGIAMFAQQHGLHREGLRCLLQGKVKSTKGWHLPGTSLPIYTVKDPQGQLHIVPYRGAETFALKHGLTQSCLNHMLLGRAPSCHGWTKVET